MMTRQDLFGAHCYDEHQGYRRYTGIGLPPSVKELLERPVLGLALYCGLIIAVFLAIELFIGATFAVPLSAYSSSFVLPSALVHFGWTARVLLLVFAVVIAVFDPARLRWQDFKGGTSLRWAIGVLAFTMVWPLTTYGYNYATDAGHLVDRALLALSLVLLIWRPAFALLLVLLAYVLFAQLTAPSIGGSVLPHKNQVLRAIELFAAFHLVRVVLGYHRTSGFLFLLGCYVATAYWLPAFAKFQLDWLSSNELNLVPMAAYAHGWRGDLSLQQIVQFGANLNSIAPLIKFIAFVVEAAFVLLFLRYRLSLFILAAAIVFHFGVFFLFGFFFWTWIALDLVLMALLIANHRGQGSEATFGLKFTPLALVLILTGAYWAKPPALAWYDTPLTYTYKFNATLENGDAVRLSPEFFAPYEDAFTMTGFSYLVKDHGILTAVYGVTDDTSMYRKINHASSFDEILELEKSQAFESYNEKRAARFYQFLETFVRNRNKKGDVQQWLYNLHSPVQFWSDISGLSRLGGTKIRRVEVIENTHYFDGTSLELARELSLHTIDVSSSR